MPNIGILYDGNDATKWSGYLSEILDRGKVTVDSLDVTSDHVDDELQSFIKESLILVLLLTPAMCETLEEKSEQYSTRLSEHSSVVVLLCFTEEEDFETFSGQCPKSKSWKILHTAESKEENRVMLGEVVDMVETLQRKHRPPPKPRTRHSLVKVFPNRIHRIKEPVTIVFPEETTGTIQIGFADADTLYDTERLNPYTYQFKAPVRDCGGVKLKIYKDGREIHVCHIVYVAPDISAYQCTSLLAQSLGVTTGGKQALDAKLAEIYDKSFPSDNTLDKMMRNLSLKSEVIKSPNEIPTILHFAAKHGLAEFCGVILDTPGSMALFQTENKDGKNPADLAEEEGFQDLADYIRMFIETAVVVRACDDYYLQMTNTHIYTNRDSSDDNDYESDIELRERLPKPKSFKKKNKDAPPSSLPISSPPDVPQKPILVGSRPRQPDPVYNTSKETDEYDEESLYAHRESLISPDEPMSDNEGEVITHRGSITEEDKRAPALPQRPGRTPEKTDPSFHLSPEEFIGIKGLPPLVPRKPSLPSPSTPEEMTDETKVKEIAGGSSSQRDLIEIAEGFKSGDFNIDEVERLYAAWRERNTSESNSIKERKESLESMRKEYNSVFEASKKQDNDFGRLSIFGKIKKWRKRKKSATDAANISKPTGKGKGSRYTKFPCGDTIPEDAVSDQVPDAQQRQSTLSNTSSSSSGSRDSRLSNVSRESSISESFDSDCDSDDSYTERRDSGMDSDGQVRRSLRMEFIDNLQSIPVEEPPPIPPRPSRKS